MDRLKGLLSFVLITAGVLVGLRLLHLGAPFVFPSTRLGPIPITSLDEVRPRVGFAPMLPAYRPAELGDQPTRMSVTLSPRPTFEIVWEQGAGYLSVTQRQGGPMPPHPPLSQPLTDVPESFWWTTGARSHLVLSRGGFWIEVETSLPTRDLRRFADTLTQY
jgi:hypothetical protein